MLFLSIGDCRIKKNKDMNLGGIYNEKSIIYDESTFGSGI